jgi:hypothetical protein
MDPRFEDLSTAINNTLTDPLILERLAKYGFDLWSYLAPQVEETMKVMMEKRQPPRELDNPISLVWAVNYASHVLEWETASRIAGERESPLQMWLDSNLPEIAGGGRELVGLVERVGYNSPEKSADLLRRIVEGYGLTSVIRIVYRSSA